MVGSDSRTIGQAGRRSCDPCFGRQDRNAPADESMIWRRVIVIAIWCYLLLDAYHQGMALPGLITALSAPALPISLMVIIVAALFTAAAWMTFRQRHRLIENVPLITPFLDRRFGEGTYRDLNRSFKPVAISIAAGLVLSVSGLRATHASTGDASAYFLGAAFLAVALGLLVAYLLSRRYPPALH